METARYAQKRAHTTAGPARTHPPLGNFVGRKVHLAHWATRGDSAQSQGHRCPPCGRASGPEPSSEVLQLGNTQAPSVGLTRPNADRSRQVAKLSLQHGKRGVACNPKAILAKPGGTGRSQRLQQTSRAGKTGFVCAIRVNQSEAKENNSGTKPRTQADAGSSRSQKPTPPRGRARAHMWSILSPQGTAQKGC